jgi:hypothetical protein
MPERVVEEMEKTRLEAASPEEREAANSTASFEGAERSAWVKTGRRGMERARQASAMRCSRGPGRVSGRRTSSAASVVERTERARETRAGPRAGSSSSSPGVSVKRTGPRGSISIALETGSVVVPGTGETTAAGWAVRAFRRALLPALRRPKREMWKREELGVAFMGSEK